MIAVARGMVVVGLWMALNAAPAGAQALPPGSDQGGAGRGPGRGRAQALQSLSNEEVYDLLDAFVMRRAQAVLQLDDEQYASFFQRMTRLQTLQREHRRQRMRMLNDLRQIAGPRGRGDLNDAAVLEKVQALDDLDAARAEDERQALAAIDEVLDARQRAQFRVFLENIERQKLELLMRARGRGN